MPEPVHSSPVCGPIGEDEPADPRREAGRCIEGRLYGPCGHELCSGVCETVGECGCSCHAPGAADTYLAIVKAPIPCRVLLAIDRMIASGEMPRRKVRRARTEIESATQREEAHG